MVDVINYGLEGDGGDRALVIESVYSELSDERIKEIAAYQFPAAKMSACTIAKEFQALLDPAEPYEYADLPAIEFAVAD